MQVCIHVWVRVCLWRPEVNVETHSSGSFMLLVEIGPGAADVASFVSSTLGFLKD